MSLDVCASRGLCLSLGSPTEQGIRIIKLFAWEKDFVSKIDKSRHDEMRSLRGYMVSFSHDVFLVVCGLFDELLPAYIRLFVPDFFSFFFLSSAYVRFCVPLDRRKAHSRPQCLVNDTAPRSMH